MKKFFTAIVLLMQVGEKLLPFIKKHTNKSSLSGLRRKYKIAAGASRFIHNRGIQKGRRQSQQEERTAIAQRMLKMGVDIGVICKATTLPKKEVIQLRDGADN